ncbi:MAG: hypothetical protein JW809_00780 [Pirellulales bacterium]|nr:hypothetical protein [Pirellulales bacterium]
MLFSYTAPHQFVALLYGIGFWGIRNQNEVEYRSLGARSSTLPPIGAMTHLVIHPTYREALDLQDKVIDTLDDAVALQKDGLVIDLPEAIDLTEYHDAVAALLQEIDEISPGDDEQSQYEDWVGEVIRLCFFRALTNLERQSCDADGRVRRDWIVSNRANSGFWEMVRARYNATQVIWECKNVPSLQSDDFQQMNYYLTPQVGRFGILCFRGEIKNHYYQHIKRISSNKDGVVILLTDKDMKVFLHQASKGKVKESHIQDIYDRTIRQIS